MKRSVDLDGDDKRLSEKTGDGAHAVEEVHVTGDSGGLSALCRLRTGRRPRYPARPPTAEDAYTESDRSAAAVRTVSEDPFSDPSLYCPPIDVIETLFDDLTSKR